MSRTSLQPSRRQLAKGAAWAAPAVLATAAVPAYAASLSYRFSTSYRAAYRVQKTSTCGRGKGIVDSFRLTSFIPYDGDLAGFGILTENGSPETTVTVNDMRLNVAFPKGLVVDISVVSGAYTVENRGIISIEGAPYNEYQAWSFIYKGQETYETGSVWPNSRLETYVTYNDEECIPFSAGERYYAGFTFDFMTANNVRLEKNTPWFDVPYDAVEIVDYNA